MTLWLVADQRSDVNCRLVFVPDCLTRCHSMNPLKKTDAPIPGWIGEIILGLTKAYEGDNF